MYPFFASSQGYGSRLIDTPLFCLHAPLFGRDNFPALSVSSIKMKPYPYGQGYKIRGKLHAGYKLIRGLHIVSDLYWFLASDCDLRSQIKDLPGREIYDHEK